MNRRRAEVTSLFIFLVCVFMFIFLDMGSRAPFVSIRSSISTRYVRSTEHFGGQFDQSLGGRLFDTRPPSDVNVDRGLSDSSFEARGLSNG